MVYGDANELARGPGCARCYPTCAGPDRHGARDVRVARPAIQLDLARSRAQLLCVGVPRDLLILVGGGQHDIARRPIHDTMIGVREDLRHQHIRW